MDNSTFEVRLSNWKSIIEESEHRPQDVTKKQWLQDHHIPEKQYYYWLRRVRKAAFSQLKPGLFPVPVSTGRTEIALAQIPAEGILSSETKAPAVVIRTKKSTVEISSDLPEELLLKLLKAVSHAI